MVLGLEREEAPVREPWRVPAQEGGARIDLGRG